MELANPLEQEVRCSVCYETLRDPHILTKCLHTFCHQCIQQIQRNGTISCPECREMSNVQEIKRDFNKQRLVDLHRAVRGPDDGVAEKGEREICGMCEEKKIVFSYCVECANNICIECHKTHLKAKPLKSHPLHTVNDMLDHKNQVEETIAGLEQEVENIEAQQAQVSTNITSIQRSNFKHIADVKEYTEDIVNSAKENEKRLVKLITNANNAVLKTLSDSDTALNENKQEILNQIGVLQESIKDLDIANLQRDRDAHRNIKTKVEKIIKSSTQNVKMNLNSPVLVKRKQNWSVTDGIEAIVVEDVKFTSTQQQQSRCVLRGLYSQLWKKTLRQSKAVELNYSRQKLICVNNLLWCVDLDGDLYVYNKDCRLVKTVKHDRIDIKNATSLTATSDKGGHIIVACDDNNGLHECLPNGNYNSQIFTGSFSDVTTYKGQLYALEYELCQLLVFKRSDGTWSKVKCTQMDHHNGSSDDRVCVNSKGIYISWWENNCISLYNIHGEYLSKIGGFGDNPGEFDCPILCDVDEYGNMLVADYDNRRLQVCDGTTGQWYVVSLVTDNDHVAYEALLDSSGECRRASPIDLGYPTCAVVGTAGELWLIQNNPDALVRFST